MEIIVDHSVGIPDGSILSVRCGGTRRQAPLETLASHPLKFPSLLGAAESESESFSLFCDAAEPAGEIGEPLKIDVLQPLASARLVLHPQEDLYSVAFEHDPEMPACLKFSII